MTEPLNPIGQCFASAIRQLLFAGDAPKDAKLCHGIGVANHPKDFGEPMGHAWIEFDHPKYGRVAMDTTWGVCTQADHYRKECQLSYVVEYSRAEALRQWKTHGYEGPWDEKIIEIMPDISA